MSTSHADPIISAYLSRLEAAMATSPPGRRNEIISEIRAHIDEALREAGASDEVTVRNVLQRLGPPEEIASAASTPGPGLLRSRGKLELAALVVLALSGILPIVGWAVGVVLVLASDAWSAREKVVGLMLGLVATLSVPLIVILTPGSGGPGPLELLVLLGWGVVSGPVSAAYLAYRLRHGTPTPDGGTLAGAGTSSA